MPKTWTLDQVALARKLHDQEIELANIQDRLGCGSITLRKMLNREHPYTFEVERRGNTFVRVSPKTQ